VTKIILTRHGHVAGIKLKRFRGRAELPLTSRDIAQAKAVARRLATGCKPAFPTDKRRPAQALTPPSGAPK
jgi:broad specificity phosphatase PhoE